MVLPEVVDDDDELVDVLVAVVLLVVAVVVLVRVVLSGFCCPTSIQWEFHLLPYE